jgi:alcohol dehydrogenase
MEYQEYFSFASAGEIIFGNGSIKLIPEILKTRLRAKKPLVVSDPGVTRAGHLEKVIKGLENDKIPFAKFEEGEPEPSLENVFLCVEQNQSTGCDSIVAVGGGSVIDLAKAVSVLLKYKGNIRDYFGNDKVPGETLPIIAIPTTAGTGSEVTAGAVLSDVKNSIKVGLRSNYLRPRIALLDPLLTLSCPKSVTAAAGFDVLAHAVGSYTMIDHTCLPKGSVLFYGSNPLTEPLATEAIRLVGQYLRTAVHQGHNREARENMLMASLLAGLAFSNTGVTHAHNITYPIGGKTHAPHGILLSVVLPAVLEFNLSVRMQRMATIGGLMGERVEGLSLREAANKGLDAIRTLIADIQLPSTLREIGLKKEDIPEMAKLAMPALNALPWNPRAMSLDDLIGILNKAY